VLAIRNQDAEGSGFEMDITWAVTENLVLSANYNYLDTDITKYPLLPGEDPEDDRTGMSLPSTADHSYGIGAEYSVTIANVGELVLRTDYNYVGERDGATDSVDPADPVAMAVTGRYLGDLEDAYTNLAARVTLESVEGDWRVSLWGQNITDEEYLIDFNTGGVGTFSSIRNTPRAYGIDVGFQF
jgi:iron complex outermembrane receptor protein